MHIISLVADSLEVSDIYMRAHNFLNLLNKLGKRHKCKALSSMLSSFCAHSDKFNITGAQKLESILLLHKNVL